MDASLCKLEWTDARTDTNGPWTTRIDERGVLAMSHPYEPAHVGNLAEAGFVLPPQAAGRRFLRFYLSDTYAGYETGNPELGYPPECFPGLTRLSQRFSPVPRGELPWTGCPG